jgi:hypothetical protein
MIVAGNHIYEQCADCGKMVRITGWFARLHLCLSPEELAARRARRAMLDQQWAWSRNQRAKTYMSAIGGGGGMRK